MSRSADHRTVRVRTHHRCIRCGVTIFPGASAETWRWFSDERDTPPESCYSHRLCARLDIGHDYDGYLDEQVGESDWRDLTVWHAPFWLATPSAWSAVAVWPVEIHEWLNTLPPIEWSY